MEVPIKPLGHTIKISHFPYLTLAATLWNGVPSNCLSMGWAQTTNSSTKTGNCFPKKYSHLSPHKSSFLTLLTLNLTKLNPTNYHLQATVISDPPLTFLLKLGVPGKLFGQPCKQNTAKHNLRCLAPSPWRETSCLEHSLSEQLVSLLLAYKHFFIEQMQLSTSL